MILEEDRNKYRELLPALKIIEATTKSIKLDNEDAFSMYGQVSEEFVNELQDIRAINTDVQKMIQTINRLTR